MLRILIDKDEIREKIEMWLSQHSDNTLFDSSICWENTICLQKTNYINKVLK